MNANGFYYHIIYSSETDKTIRHFSRLQSLRLQHINTYNDTYSVHDEALKSHRGCLLCLLASCERRSVSTIGYQLLIFSSARLGGSPSSPPIHGDPLSPSVHTHPRLLVCYNYNNLSHNNLLKIHTKVIFRPFLVDFSKMYCLIFKFDATSLHPPAPPWPHIIVNSCTAQVLN